MDSSDSYVYIVRNVCLACTKLRIRNNNAMERGCVCENVTSVPITFTPISISFLLLGTFVCHSHGNPMGRVKATNPTHTSTAQVRLLLQPPREQLPGTVVKLNCQGQSHRRLIRGQS